METYEELDNFIEEENIRFLRFAFLDVFGVQKNAAAMASELPRILREGIAIDASSIAGFGADIRSDLFLRPDPSTISIVPWRPLDGRVARMFSYIEYPDGRPFEYDVRRILREAVRAAEDCGLHV